MNRASLYIHIPFCRKKCDYCDFFSRPEERAGNRGCGEKDREAIPSAYIDAVCREIAFYAEHYQIAAWNSIYIGGGTPSLLSPAQLCTIMNHIRGAAPLAHEEEAAEVTMEMNPESVTESSIESAAAAGINRISVGIQALDDRALQAVHRLCSVKESRDALELLSRTWAAEYKKRLSADMIAGLPSHTVKSFRQGLTELCSSYSLDHISLYTLTVEEGTPLARRIENGSVRWSAEKADRMWLSGRRILEQHGFRQYEVSNFAKPGCESRHNTVYWQLQSYIGCGAGASGSWYGDARKNGEAGCTPGLRWTNTTDIHAYQSFWSQPQKKDAYLKPPRATEELSGNTQRFEYLMMGFRMLKGISEAAYRNRFNAELQDALTLSAEDGLFSKWQHMHLARITGKAPDRQFALTRRGILLLNRFLEEIPLEPED
ncbi:MAG: radical SAM family heme chaperone HemW [Treponema sp.]|nr:radical SAM family heme chaperone HemW [Treponema sp.]